MISIDLGGGSLSQRGWRREAGEAPLREHLAAVLLMLVRFDPRTRRRSSIRCAARARSRSRRCTPRARRRVATPALAALGLTAPRGPRRAAAAVRRRGAARDRLRHRSRGARRRARQRARRRRRRTTITWQRADVAHAAPRGDRGHRARARPRGRAPGLLLSQPAVRRAARRARPRASSTRALAAACRAVPRLARRASSSATRCSRRCSSASSAARGSRSRSRTRTCARTSISTICSGSVAWRAAHARDQLEVVDDPRVVVAPDVGDHHHRAARELRRQVDRVVARAGAVLDLADQIERLVRDRTEQLAARAVRRCRTASPCGRRRGSGTGARGPRARPRGCRSSRRGGRRTRRPRSRPG